VIEIPAGGVTMRISKPYLIPLAIAAVFSVVISSCSLFEKKLKVEIPDARWPKIFFRQIDVMTELSSLKRLRETHLAENDIEIRVWRGFSLAPLEGVILRQNAGKWSALYIISDDCCEIKKAFMTELPPPKSGWASFWNRIDEAGILTIADYSLVCEESPRNEEISQVVEINKDNVYRTYMHSVTGAKCEESQKMKKIGRIIAEEFYDGKEECIDARWFPCVSKYGVQNDL
jgi:hypothetical protein